MKGFITLPFHDDGIREVEILSAHSNGTLSYSDGGGCVCYSFGWLVEGATWHRKRKDAVKTAKIHRQNRIAEAAKELHRLIELPPIGEP